MLDFLNFYTYAYKRESEKAISVHLFWLDFLAFVDGPVSVSTVVFLSS